MVFRVSFSFSLSPSSHMLPLALRLITRKHGNDLTASFPSQVLLVCSFPLISDDSFSPHLLQRQTHFLPSILAPNPADLPLSHASWAQLARTPEKVQQETREEADEETQEIAARRVTRSIRSPSPSFARVIFNSYSNMTSLHGWRASFSSSSSSPSSCVVFPPSNFSYFFLVAFDFTPTTAAAHPFKLQFNQV